MYTWNYYIHLAISRACLETFRIQLHMWYFLYKGVTLEVTKDGPLCQRKQAVYDLNILDTNLYHIREIKVSVAIPHSFAHQPCLSVSLFNEFY